MLTVREPIRQFRVRKGRLSIPVSFPDDKLVTVEQVGDTLMVFPGADRSPALAAMLDFRREADAAGVSLKELLKGLDAEATSSTRRTYGAR